MEDTLFGFFFVLQMKFSELIIWPKNKRKCWLTALYQVSTDRDTYSLETFPYLLGIAFECCYFIRVVSCFLLLPQQPDPVVQPSRKVFEVCCQSKIFHQPVSCESNIKECFTEACDYPGRPGTVSSEIHSNENHAGGDLWSIWPPTFLPDRFRKIFEHNNWKIFVSHLWAELTCSTTAP